MFDMTTQNQGADLQTTVPGGVPGQQGPGNTAPTESTTAVPPGQGGLTTSNDQPTVPSDTIPPSLLSAPTLPAPHLRGMDGNAHLSMETAVIYAMGAGARTSQSQMNTLLNRQTAQAQDLKNIRDERIGELLEAAKNAEKAEKSQGLAKALGIFAMVASVIITAASIGTASPAGAALMVVGTGMTMVAGADALSGGKVYSNKIDNQWAALAVSLTLTIVGSAMTMGGAAMISSAMKAKSLAATQGAANATRTTGQTANLAKSATAAGNGVKAGGKVGSTGAQASTKGGTAAQQGAAQSDNMMSGSMIERLAKMGSKSNNPTVVQAQAQKMQLRAGQLQGAVEVSASTADIPVAVHSYRASAARADAKDLKADAAFVEARISQIQSYLQTASQQMAKNYQGMANVVAGLRDANSAAFR